MVESAEEIAFRFLVDFHNGDTELIKGWRSNARREWCLTLQLCMSYADEIERLRAVLEEYACYGLAKCNAPKLKDGTCIHAGSGHCGDLAFRALEQTVTTEKTS